MISSVNRVITAQRGATSGATSTNRAVIVWLLTVCVLVMGLSIFGGYVRLTRSGLSIVEWNVVTGVLPLLGEEAWQATFAKYQQTPEFQQVNATMTLAGYKTIFYVEYFHRLIARMAGLIVILPLGIFLWRGTIPWRRSGVYLLIAVLFGFQGFLGWYMVSSGLVDRPSVSPYRLAAHLLTALAVLALTLWTALNQMGVRTAVPPAARTAPARLALLLLAVLVIQIAYGALVAGLKAGHTSDTFPLMFGYLAPPGLLAVAQPWWVNLVATGATVHFVHRWFAFVVLALAAILLFLTRRLRHPLPVQRVAGLIVALVIVQIGLGISVIWFHVPLALALSHQATALLLFAAVIVLNHQLWLGWDVTGRR